MPACGQAVECGVCDTPELWCGAGGLCARVRACAAAAESVHTYIHSTLETGRVHKQKNINTRSREPELLSVPIGTKVATRVAASTPPPSI